MKYYFPNWYEKFHCVGGACPDSCCTGWEIVVDEETTCYYETVEGELGNRLRTAMQTDADGDTIFKGKTKDCPFWNEKHLCDIHAELGEDALCDTCYMFPRLSQDHGDFISYDLSLACPEAAKIYFATNPKDFQIQIKDSDETSATVDYDLEQMKNAVALQAEMIGILKNTALSMADALLQCIALAQDTNTLESQQEIPTNEILDFLQHLEILTEDWQKLLTSTSKNTCCTKSIETSIRLYAIDYIYRCLPTIAYGTTTITACICEMLFAILTVVILQSSHPKLPDWRIWQLYTKEIDGDSDNRESVIAFGENCTMLRLYKTILKFLEK